MGKLLAIDGLNIVRRVYEANPDEDSPEKAEIALRNAFSSFRRLLDTHQPTHVLAAFDFGGLTWRNEIHPQYRAYRTPMPPVLRERLPGFYDMLPSLGLKVLCLERVEADDVIATAVLRWLGEGRGDAIVSSTDKDLHVLISFGALLWDHFKNEWHDRAWVEKKFGVTPEMLTDLLALCGDSTEGIPGVEGIGQKSAAKLLNAYKTLEGIMAGAGILLTATGQKLRAGRDMAFLSRELVKLKTDVRLGVTWKTLQYGDNA
ncbi:MAG TPA: 5'-3' exonuclease H3TH domain-containing protein [Noviherbaspirillum sp.]|nr:5'-3' exonuclease H3TH domain-containing protein [Noviherbaspirillum sp.]